MTAFDETAVRAAYLAALKEEREETLRLRTLERVQVITRSMKPQEQVDYFASRAFENALMQTRRKDRLWRQLDEGTWPEEAEAEFDRLGGLIAAQLRQGEKLNLDFLRSVRRIRQPLRKAQQALRLSEEGKLSAELRAQAADLAGEMDRAVAEHLRQGELQYLLQSRDKAGTIVDLVLKTAFRQGLPPAAVDQALGEGGLAGRLQERICRAHPVLRDCAELRLPEGGAVSRRVRTEARGAAEAVLRALRGRFPTKRCRELLSRNASLMSMQKKSDRDRMSRKNLQQALLRAIPEQVRDLYPLARRMRRRFVLHLGPTNSGKTWESIGRLEAARHGIYLGPLRLLAFEQFETMNLANVPCSLVTGEERILVPGAAVQSSTIEMADLNETYDIAVIDECQMIADRDRGGAWTAAVLGLQAEEIHICASPDAEGLLLGIIGDCGDEVSVVRHERMTPLQVEREGFHFPAGVRKGDALIVFSRVRVHALAAELKQRGYRVSLIYGALPPDVRRDQAERFRNGETDVVVSTDAIAMGMNLPIARVVFMESEKYDGDITRPLTDSEIRQIAGRAGRFGQYDIGWVNAHGFKSVVAQALQRPMPPLTHAMLRFPESLLGLPLPLTETINRWISMKDQGCFTKASTQRMAMLASRMETRTTDKRLLYDFICIPFDETDPDLFEKWKVLYHAETQRRHVDVMGLLPDYVDPEQCTVAMLERLERDYRRCDLYYNYARRFYKEPEETLTAIQQRKDLISSGITHVLTTQKLPGRVCTRCGRHLSWDWAYTVCENCWRRGY